MVPSKSLASADNVTLVGSQAADLGFLLRLGAAMELGNCIITGFGEFGIQMVDASTLANIDAETVRSCMLWNNAGSNTLAGMVNPANLAFVQGQANIITANPMLRNTRWEPNPDPRPMDGSPVFTVGTSLTPPSVMNGYLPADCCKGGFFDTDAHYLGAFGEELWIEEWTRFGDESWYSQP